MNEARLREHFSAKLAESSAAAERGDNQEAYQLSTMLVEAIGFYRRNWNIDLSDLFPRVVAAQPAYQLVLAITAQYLLENGMNDAAVCIAGAAASLNMPGNYFALLQIRMLRKANRLDQARALCREILSMRPDDLNVLSELAECDIEERFSPQDYYQLLDTAHRLCRPKNYLEIGVAQGRSLALARRETRAIGIDPDTAEPGRYFFLSPENQPHLFRKRSDDFFLSGDLAALPGDSTIDMAFLDGLHIFEQVLRDFINTERCAAASSLIFIHDCLPINTVVASRERCTSYWVGDVWKIIPCLKAVRPDLEIITFPASPSGLALIRRLDPSSQILERQFEQIVQHFMEYSLPEEWQEKLGMFNVTDKSLEQVLEESRATRG